MTTPFWVSAFIDCAPGHFAAGVRFWSAATAYDVSAARGTHGEFATLVPPQGDAHLRVQRLGTGEDRVHLDLHVADPRAAADRAVRLGAREVTDDGYVAMESPGGLAFGWDRRPSSVRAEYSALARPEDQPVRLLLQRLDEAHGPARAHLDWSTTDREAETARHVALGASVEGWHAWWTVLTDPLGRRYCITDRDPETGMLPAPAAQ